MKTQALGILGLGFLGKTLWEQGGKAYSASWATVHHTPPESRNNDDLGRWIPFEWAESGTWERLPKDSLPLVLTIAPLTRDLAQEARHLRAWAEWMKQERPALQRLIYISTTGVYPDQDGLWTEASRFEPDSFSGSVRRMTEDLLGQYFQLSVVRAGGIYGPGRNLGMRLREGRAIPGGERPTHRIHVEDLAGIVWALCSHPQPPPCVNAVDDEPCPSLQVAEWLLAQKWVSVPAGRSGMETLRPAGDFPGSGHSQQRLISNQVLKQDLGYRLRFPTYREGMRQALQIL